MMRNRLLITLLVLIQAELLLWILFKLSSTISNEDQKLLTSSKEDQKSTTISKEDKKSPLIRYQPPSQSGVRGKGRRLEVHKIFWRRKSLRYLNLTRELAEDFVIVTAGNFFFYSQNLAAISTVQKFFPGRSLFFYDLEKRDHIDEFIAQKFNALCGVTYRQFNFTLYPDHVRNLRLYSWKPLIIYEMLKEFPGVLWIDSSIRFISNNFSSIFQKAVESDGMLALTSTGHSNFAVTHPHMYEFLPTSIDGMIKTDQHEANCLLLYRTRPAFENVVWWWMLCALDPHCIAPISILKCNDPYKSRSVYAICHRFDQSALNILLANYFAFDYMRYFGSAIVAEVRRFYDRFNRDIIVCVPGESKRTRTYHNYLENTQSTTNSLLPSILLIVLLNNSIFIALKVVCSGVCSICIY